MLLIHSRVCGNLCCEKNVNTRGLYPDRRGGQETETVSNSVVCLSYLSTTKTTDRKFGSLGMGADYYSAYISPKNDIMNEILRVLLSSASKRWDNTFLVLINSLFTVITVNHSSL
jgi:hypothetical protein